MKAKRKNNKHNPEFNISPKDWINILFIPKYILCICIKYLDSVI